MKICHFANNSVAVGKTSCKLTLAISSWWLTKGRPPLKWERPRWPMPFKCLIEETHKLSSQINLGLKENRQKHSRHLCWWCSARGSRWGHCHIDRHSTRWPVCTPTDQSGPQTPRTTEEYKQQFQSTALCWLSKKGQCYTPSTIQ